MKILVACEYSGVVRDAFRRGGHDAWSCDILPTDADPTYHIQGDVLEILNDDWDIIIAHPPCTHLAVSGARHFAEKRKDGRQREAINFFMQFANIKCPRVAIENPVCIISSIWRKPDQVIQPYEFGHPYIKTTCLWLKNLPRLKPTNILTKPTDGWQNQHFQDGKYKGFKTMDEMGKVLAWNNPKTAHIRSKTFQGIADAMAEQWGNIQSGTMPGFSFSEQLALF